MARITETELQRRIKNLEIGNLTAANKPLLRKKGGTYEYSSDYTYIAYASNISNASTTGVITDQSDATGFSFSAISDSGEALGWLGYWTSKSLEQSGDPTDYIWADLSADMPASSITLYYTESTKLLTDIGNPDFPVAGVTWVSFSGSTPATAFWVATRYTINGSKTPWRIIPIKIKKSNLGLIVYAISGRDKPVLNDTQWKADAITAISISTGETYSTINEMGFGTAISITYDNGKLHGMLKNVSGTPTWVTPVDFLDGDLLVDGTIIAGKIANNAIITDKLAANAITTTKIATDAITTPKIVANAITATEIAADAVTANEILAGTITATEIAAAAVTTNKLAANAVTADIIAAGAVIADKIASNAITTVKLAAASITSNKLVVTGTGAIGAGTIGASTVAATQAAQATADGQIIGFFQPAAPTSGHKFGDIWIDTDLATPLTAASIYRYQDSSGGSQNSLSWVATPTDALGKIYLNAYTAQLAANNAASDAADAQEAADGEIVGFFQDGEPSSGSSSFGDMWIDTDKSDPLIASSIHRYQNENGGSSGTLLWRATPNNALGKLYLESYDAQASADLKITTFYQTGVPTSLAVGDLWVDTDDNNKLWRAKIVGADENATGTEWASVQDGTISVAQAAATTAASAASAAQTTADGEITGYFQIAAPDSNSTPVPSFGDIWIDTDATVNNLLTAASISRYQDSSGGSQGTLGWVATPTNALGLLYLESYGAQGTANLAVTNAANAQEAADGEIIAFFQDAEPTNANSDPDPAFGDIWIDTDKSDPLIATSIHRYQDSSGGSSGTLAWVATATNALGLLYLESYDAQASADLKIKTFYQTGIPTSLAIGDLWVDTDDSNKLYRAEIVGADAITSGEWVTVRDTTIAAAQLAATNAATAATAAQTTATAATTTLTNIASDSVLTPTEKLHAKTLWNAIVAEKAGIIASATNAGIATSATVYETYFKASTGAYQLLDIYLNTTETVFSSMTTDTTIDAVSPDTAREVWDAKWSGYYGAKQALLDAIAAALKTIADTAQTTASSATSDISDMAADNKLTPMEKLQAKTLWDAVLAEKPGIVTSAANAVVASTTYVAKYDALNTYLNTTETVFDDMAATTTIDGTSNPTVAARVVWDTKWKEYYGQKQILLDAIAAALKVIADAGVADAATAQAAATSAATAASNAQGTATTATNTLADIADDDKLTPSEKQQAKTLWDAVAIEYSGIISSASNASVVSTAYATAYTTLNTYLNTTTEVFVADDMDETADITRTTWDTSWSGYYEQKQILLNAIAAKLKIIGDAAQVSANLRITSFYQDDIPTSLAIGDLWTDTNNNFHLYRAFAVGATTITAANASPVGWVTVVDESILTAYTLADSKVLPENVAAAVNAGETTINGASITTGEISAAHIDTVGITADAMNLNGVLTVADTAEGAIRWGKTDGNDISTAGLFIGNEEVSTGPSVIKQKLVMGSASSFIWYDGTEVFLIGTTSAPNVGDTAHVIEQSDFTNSTSKLIYQPSPIKPKVRIEAVSAGGGGGHGYNNSNGSLPGGDMKILVEKQDPNTPGSYLTRHTILLTGGKNGIGHPLSGDYTNYPSGRYTGGMGGQFFFHDHDASSPTTTTVSSSPNSWQVNVSSTTGFPAQGTIRSSAGNYWSYHTKTSGQFTGYISHYSSISGTITLVYSASYQNNNAWSDLPSSYGTVIFESKDGGPRGEYVDGTTGYGRGGYGGSATVSNTATRTTSVFPTEPDTGGGDAYNDESSAANLAKTPDPSSHGVGGGGGGGQSGAGYYDGKAGGGASGAYIDMQYIMVANTDRIRVTAFGIAGTGGNESSTSTNEGDDGTGGVIRLIGAD